MGWQVIWLLSFGQIRPKEENYYKSNVAALLGLYAWLMIPTMSHLLFKQIGL